VNRFPSRMRKSSEEPLRLYRTDCVCGLTFGCIITWVCTPSALNICMADVRLQPATLSVIAPRHTTVRGQSLQLDKCGAIERKTGYSPYPSRLTGSWPYRFSCACFACCEGRRSASRLPILSLPTAYMAIVEKQSFQKPLLINCHMHSISAALS
jgi:hypothetical protein